MSLTLLPGYNYPNEIRQLFSEYTQLLASGDPEFWEYLQIQHYDDEIEHPDHKYGPPNGRLYLALWNGQAAGCAALRQISQSECEMKRLYVRPEYQGNGIGDALVAQIIDDARSIGYSHLKLDTFPFLTRAIVMYRNLGFYEIPKYNDSPMASTIYMQLDLQT